MSDRRPKFRCSELDSVFRCHGRKTLTDRLAEWALRNGEPDETGEFASVGLWGHYLIARWAMRYQQAYAPEHGLARPNLAPSFRPSNYDRWTVVFCCRELLRNVDADMALEVEVELTAEFPKFDLSGHIDVLAIDALAKRAKAWDWKLGWSTVDPAEANNQVMGYIVLLFIAYPTLQEVTFYLVQPRQRVDMGEERVTEVTVQRSEFQRVMHYLNAQVERVIANPRELQNGRSQCRYCPAMVTSAGVCPAVKADIDAMKYLLNDDEITRLTDGSVDFPELFETMRALKALDTTCETVETRVKHLLFKAGPRTGITLPDGRRVHMKERVARRHFTLMGRRQFDRIAGVLGEDAAMVFYDASPAEVEERLGQTLRGPDGKPLPKNSSKPEKMTVRSEFTRLFGEDVGEKMTTQIVVDPAP